MFSNYVIYALLGHFVTAWHVADAPILKEAAAIRSWVRGGEVVNATKLPRDAPYQPSTIPGKNKSRTLRASGHWDAIGTPLNVDLRSFLLQLTSL
jgi:hypothetical protein